MSRGARTLLALSLVLSQLAAPATPRDLEAALEQLVDPGLPLVERAAAAEALAAPDAGLELAERRAELLADRALRDPAVELRAAALEALALVEGPRASVELARLVADLPDPEATRAAELLAERRTAARELLDLLHRGLGEDPLPGVRLAALLEGLGMAFALEGGPGDRVLFTRARMHGEAEVQDRAGAALEKALTRLASLRLDDRAVGLLEDLEGAPWPAAELGLRRSLYHITSGRDLEEALAAAARVQRETRGRLDHEGRRLRFLGLYTEALALFGLGRHHKVGGPLVRASLVLDGLAAERRDLLPVPEQPSVIMARRQAEVLEWRGAVELLGATVALAGGAETTDPRVLEHLRQAHEFSLWAQLREAAVDDKVGLSGFDVVLDGAWSPRRLVLSAPDNPVWSGDRRGAALELVLDLGEALALVLGEEMPGFVAPTAVPRSEAGEPLFGPPTSDPRRFALLKMMRPAQAMALQRRLDATWDLLEMRILEQRLRGLGEVIARDEASGWADLSDLRLPSIWGLFVVGDLRAEDRAEEAVELSVRLFDDLEASGSFDRAAWGAWLAAGSRSTRAAPSATPADPGTRSACSAPPPVASRRSRTRSSSASAPSAIRARWSSTTSSLRRPGTCAPRPSWARPSTATCASAIPSRRSCTSSRPTSWTRASSCAGCWLATARASARWRRRGPCCAPCGRCRRSTTT